MSENKKLSRREVLTKSAIAATGLAAMPSIGFGASQTGNQHEIQDNSYWQGKCAFITGGARGIGYATALELAKEGVNIALYDIAEQLEHVNYSLATEADLKKAKADIEALGVQCLTFKGDVRDSKRLKSSVDETLKTFTTIDFLVVNAGVTHAGLFDEFPQEKIQTVVDINVIGSVNTIQAALPAMRKQQSGRIIVVSSILGRQGNDAFSVYTSTKWALIGLAKSTALMAAKDNVMCNAVCPTLINTKLANNPYLLGAMAPGDPNPTWEKVTAWLSNNNPIPIGAYEPDVVGKIIKLFCNESTALMTGEVFDISAGTNANYPA